MSDRTGDTERPADETPSVDPETLADRLRSSSGGSQSLTVLDVRDRDEFERWHLEGDGLEAVQIPHMRFVQAEATGRVSDLVDDHELEEPILAVCGRGEASAHAVSLLREAGIDARNLAGGMDAWAELYVGRELDVDAPGTGTTVLQYDRPSSGCLAYAVVSDGEAAVIDPLRAFTDRYVEDLDDRGVEVRYAMDTHVHADHISGVRDLAARTDAEAVVPAGSRDRGLAFDATTVDDGDELRVGGATLSVLATPGHTSESVSFRLEGVAGGDGGRDAGPATLFTGDTLFLEGVGRPDLEGGDGGVSTAARQLRETLRDRVLALPDDTTVAPGHYGDAADPRGDGGYAATLGTLRDRLTALSMDETEFVARVTEDLPPRPNNDERIVEVNLGREDVDEETAFELELGPNNCAVGE